VATLLDHAKETLEERSPTFGTFTFRGFLAAAANFSRKSA
jgi:hypothetical protein